jgi:L-fuconolactonase
MDIIDAHVHLWTDDLVRYPERAPRPAYMRQRRFEPEEYWALAEPLGVRRAVLIQTEIYGDDLSYAIDIAARDDRFRVIGLVDIESPPSRDELTARIAAGVAGYRLLMRTAAEVAALRGGKAARFLDNCASLGLVIAPLATPVAFADIDAMCAARPKLRVVVDHMGLVQPHSSSCARDLAALCELSKYRNAHVKLSGFWALGNGLPHDDLLQQLDALLAAFGAARLVWGSDDPYLRWRSNYAVGLALLRERWRVCNVDRGAVLGGNAARIYFDQSVS